MKVIIKEPDVPAVIANIDGTLRGMQGIVGGYIQTVPLEWLACINKSDLSCLALRGKEFIVVMNEEGKLDCLPYNIAMKSDFIVGTCVVCREDGEEMAGLTDEEAGTILGLIRV